MSRTFALALTATLVALRGALAAEWGYAQNGADWESGECASGIHQSPVNLDTYSAVRHTFAIEFDESSTPDSGWVKNNGHTMVYYPNTDGAVTILNPMDGDAEYTLAQFHCHWDASAFRSNLGSEHTLDEHPYPLECHFVHYRTAYDTLGEAVTHSDGLMVVGQFYEIDDDADNPELDKFLDAADNVIEVGSNYTLTENLAITPFVTNNSHVYTYSGSLTTPTCNEVVQWYVFRTPMGVPLAKLEKLWALDKDNASTIEHNWRPTQPLNGRTVHRNFAYTRYGNNDDADGGISTGDHSGAMRTSPTTSSVALACLLSIVIVAFVC